jgi:hypothetical protein
MVCLHQPPGRPMFQHRIEDREQLAHADRQLHLLRLPGSLQALIEGSNDGIELHLSDRATCPQFKGGTPAVNKKPVIIGQEL